MQIQIVCFQVTYDQGKEYEDNWHKHDLKQCMKWERKIYGLKI